MTIRGDTWAEVAIKTVMYGILGWMMSHYGAPSWAVIMTVIIVTACGR